MQEANFVAGEWIKGTGEEFISVDPATGKEVWRGTAVGVHQLDQAVNAACLAFNSWRKLSLEGRAIYLEKFGNAIEKRKDELAITLALETGKPLWESKTEIGAMIGKLAISKEAYADRCRELFKDNNGIVSVTRHKPHGVVAVIGPFNFPGHIPNGHIIPALLAGNTVILKPSELTPFISMQIMQCWEEANLPPGVINLIHGGAELSKQLTVHTNVAGVFFTGSSSTGYKIQESLLQTPEKILALEMGGNNPLVVHNPGDIDAAIYNTLQSAYITAGQRCTCARRLIMQRSPEHEDFFAKLTNAVSNIQVGAYTDKPEPFMGPVISNHAAENALEQYDNLVATGANVVVPMKRLDSKTAFLSPGIIDVTEADNTPDYEVFGPLLSVTWVQSLSEAIFEANNTNYGLSAGILAANRDDYLEFYADARAGLINWNRPLTGASSAAPFGGIGRSGNYRPSAYYAADYCAYPIASLEEKDMRLPEKLSPGIKL